MATPTRQNASRQTEEQAPPHVVGPKSTHTGMTIHPGPVEVWGTIRGRLIATSVSVKPGGTIEGQVDANRVRNNGTILGTIRTPLLELSKNSTTGGRVQAEAIGMEPGATLREDTAVFTPRPGTIPHLHAEALAQQAEEQSRAMQNRRREDVVRPLPAPAPPARQAAFREDRPTAAPTPMPALPLPSRAEIPPPPEADDAPRPFLVGASG